ncbi:MAG: hypothetical protein M1485_06935 [Chloroflexi bacterium]|nr:hypothetical protein [Chloroflexota bacterium]
MEKIKTFLKSDLFVSISLLILVSAAAYLPFIGHFRYFNDDWYEMFSAGAKGPQVFNSLFAIDRPGRAFLMIPLYMLFGQNPLPYNITAYFFRLFSGLCVWWTLRTVWPKQKRTALLTALFFTVYPGFLSQPNAIDYQSHIAALFFATFSIALTVQAVLAQKTSGRMGLIVLSVFFGFANLSQMEYYIGFEVIRLVFVFLLASRSSTGWKERLLKTVRLILPFLLAPISFLTWRFFFFQSLRKATDVNLQLGMLFISPLHTTLVWSTNLLHDALNVLLFAWGVPVYQALASLSPLDMLYGFGLAALCIALTLLTLRFIPEAQADSDTWVSESLWAGLVILFSGLLPITMVNRSVVFPDSSRYTLIGLLGAVLIFAVLISLLKSQRLQLVLISILVGLASITHFANGLSAARSADSMSAFWWQVSWRIPQIEKNTTLIVNYSGSAAAEDYFVWGPANLIYYPESQSPRYIQPGIYAALLDHSTVTKVLTGVKQPYVKRRSITTYPNYRNILVLTQPTAQSCVQVIDGAQLEFSPYEDERIMQIAPYSEAGRVLPGPDFHVPPYPGFGSEPTRSWCYYYEKAAYARQTNNWQEVTRLAEEATRLGFAPSDPIEWMPFLQAYALNGNKSQLTELAPSVVADPFVAQQACHILSGMPNLSPSVAAVVKSLYCAASQ